MKVTLEELQQRISAWVIDRLGEKVFQDKEERGLRSLEEQIELGQALGIPRERALRLVNVVYDKPVGDLRQEFAGSLLTLLAAASSAGINLLEVCEEEVIRVEGLPHRLFQKTQ